MRYLLRHLFGATSENALIVNEDGMDWVRASHLCDLLGIVDENNMLKDLGSGQDLNLVEADKRKIQIEGLRHGRQVWFVSESGLWKIISRSHNYDVAILRHTILTSI